MRLGHLPSYKLSTLNVVTANECNKAQLRSCDVCAQARQPRLSFPDSSINTMHPFHMIHIDVRGHIECLLWMVIGIF